MTRPPRDATRCSQTLWARRESTYIKQILPRHSWLPWNPGRDYDNIRPFEALRQRVLAFVSLRPMSGPKNQIHPTSPATKPCAQSQVLQNPGHCSVTEPCRSSLGQTTHDAPFTCLFLFLLCTTANSHEGLQLPAHETQPHIAYQPLADPITWELQAVPELHQGVCYSPRALQPTTASARKVLRRKAIT